jgi:hypothetical protein
LSVTSRRASQFPENATSAPLLGGGTISPFSLHHEAGYLQIEGFYVCIEQNEEAVIDAEHVAHEKSERWKAEE